MRNLLSLTVATALPVALTTTLWHNVWEGFRPYAWDGSGHYALAEIYDQTIFPDTFGWTHAYFGGMPFPNFYPPLFYWCVALLHHTHLFSFAASFKLVLALPVILLPCSVWMLAWAVSDKNHTVATGAAFGCLPILIDYRFRLVLFPSGLDYVSTFQVGLYTQTLGFILLIAWLVVYTELYRGRRQLALASVLLALTLLANFFNAITAVVYIVATLINDVARYRSVKDGRKRDEEWYVIIWHLSSPLIAMALTLFWSVPMLSEYDYFVTRPNTIPSFDFIPPAMWWWYILSIIGFLLWLRRPSRTMVPFLAVCVAMEVAIVFTNEIAPRWFPLQPLRFLSTLNLLLAVPVGQVFAAIIDLLARALKGLYSWKRSSAGRGSPYPDPGRFLHPLAMTGVALTMALTVSVLIKPPIYGDVFSVATDDERTGAAFDFARQHTDGRYLVEHSIYTYPRSTLDVRALTSYLGSQGNESVSVVFREASPNAIFFNPLVGALSAYQDSYGITSVLADDIDFAEQTLDRHLERARFIGVKYLVIATPQIKDRLAHEQNIAARYDLGLWSIFELRAGQVARVNVLPYRPALVVSSLSLKQRRRNEYDFVRFAEEQFNDGWFDVMLARSPESRIDHIRELDQFGALILDTYNCDNEDLAFERIRDFARRRPLVLLSSDTTLFRRIRASINEFALATIVERSPEAPGPWIEAEGPSYRYNSSPVRKEWGVIRGILNEHKVTTGSAPLLSSEIKQASISISPEAPLTESVPVLIKTTYHPNWRRTDGAGAYAVTPFFTLTFIKRQSNLVYERRWYDWIGLLGSVSALVFLGCFTLWNWQRKFAGRR